MKKIFLGLALGLLISGVIVILVGPGIKQEAHDKGVAEGIKTGTAAGITQGIGQGVAQVHEELKRRQDSLVTVQKANEAKAKALAARKPKVVVMPQQNWHVIEGKIADPIHSVPEKKDDKLDKKVEGAEAK